MQEQLELLRSYLRMAWLYRWFALVVSVVACMGGWIYVYAIPDTYEVSTKLFIDTRSLLRPLLQGIAIDRNLLSDSAALMRRTLLTRPNVEDVARRTDLDLKTTNQREFDEMVDDVSSRIQIIGDRNTENTYDIRFEDPDPKLAKRFVDELLNKFLEAALGENRQDTATTQKFLDEQIADYEQKLIAAEDRRTEFRQRNIVYLTGSQEGYFNQLKQAGEQLEQARLELNEAANRRNDLAQQIESDNDAFAASEWMNDAPSPVISGIDVRIQNLQQKVDELLLTYTDKHPDVVAARQTIASLEERRAKEIEALISAADEAGPTASIGADSPFKQQMKFALVEADGMVASLRTRVQIFEKRVEELEKLVDTVPQVESESQRMDRDYGIIKGQFDQLLSRREQMRLGSKVEQAGDNVEIRVLEPPREPLSPTGPKRLQMLSIAFLVSLAAGAGLAFLLSQINPRVFNNRELKELTGVPVMGSISLLTGMQYRRQRFAEMMAFSLGLFGLVSVYGISAALDLMNVNVHGYVAAVAGLFG